MIANLIFDFDGTVVDSADDIIDCLTLSYGMFPQYRGIKIDRKIIGPPLTDMI